MLFAQPGSDSSCRRRGVEDQEKQIQLEKVVALQGKPTKSDFAHKVLQKPGSGVPVLASVVDVDVRAYVGVP